MVRENRLKILIFVAVSLFLHALLYAALPKKFSDLKDRAPGLVTVTLQVRKKTAAPALPPKPEVKPPEPKLEPEKAPKPVVARTQAEPPKKQDAPKPVQPAAAPAMLPDTAVTSRGGESEAAAPVVPVGKGNDTGGTGFTDSKGTSREIRRIETGEAPPPAPVPVVQRKVEVEKPAPPPAPVDLNAIRTAYARTIKERIDARKEYPQTARRRGQEGVVTVQFTLSREGGVSGISVAKSGGFDSLDNAAQDAVRRAAPFPPIPKELGRDEFTLRVSIVFKLNQE